MERPPSTQRGSSPLVVEIDIDVTQAKLSEALQNDGGLVRARTWSSAERSGPELGNPSRGEHHVETVPLTVEGLAAIDLQPAAIAAQVTEHLRRGVDLFTLPESRADGGRKQTRGRSTTVARS
jgi:hypothetical protein